MSTSTLSFRWALKLLPLWVLLAAAGTYYFVFKPDNEVTEKEEENKQGLAKAEAYYLHVGLIEVYPTGEDEDGWDPVGDSAPDLFYELELHGQDVFKSTTKDDTFIAQWSPVGIDAIELIKTGRISADNAIQAVRIGLSHNETLILRIYDEDVTNDDEVATITLRPSEWNSSLKKLEFERTSDRFVKRVHVRLFPSTMTASDIIKQLEGGG
jgi:hypothetical protein